MFADSRMLATLPVSDLDSAVSWYSEKLGLRATEVVEGEGAFYDTGGVRFALYPSAFAGSNHATAASFIVDDFDAAVRRLRDAGVAFEEFDPGAGQMADGVLTMENGTRAAWFKDADGNILAVSHRRSR